MVAVTRRHRIGDVSRVHARADLGTREHAAAERVRRRVAERVGQVLIEFGAAVLATAVWMGGVLATGG